MDKELSENEVQWLEKREKAESVAKQITEIVKAAKGRTLNMDELTRLTEVYSEGVDVNGEMAKLLTPDSDEWGRKFSYLLVMTSSLKDVNKVIKTTIEIKALERVQRLTKLN